MLTEETVEHEDALAMRLMVLEMTVATIAARLPKADMQEVAAVLVFVANCADAALELPSPLDRAKLSLAQHYATEMLERMTKVRRSRHGVGRRH